MAEESKTEEHQTLTASAVSAPVVGTQSQTQMLQEASNLETLLSKILTMQVQAKKKVIPPTPVPMVGTVINDIPWTG